ncbi:hypothetical protein Hypma_004956 [Hypsizygus marmoreus]|uniref:Uncharacterized protein n=1 Tax=Hypsizygus marmoreus TaxID=39966 RepID=A0A369K2R4_HYPMA|nr:hypothetical protein Hypma_004956 [Hypsizygus marmoreus]
MAPPPTRRVHHPAFQQPEYPSSRHVQCYVSPTNSSRSDNAGIRRRDLIPLKLHSNRIQIPFSSAFDSLPTFNHSRVTAAPSTTYPHTLATTTRHRAHAAPLQTTRSSQHASIHANYIRQRLRTHPPTSLRARNPCTQHPGAHDFVTTPIPIWEGRQTNARGMEGTTGSEVRSGIAHMSDRGASHRSTDTPAQNDILIRWERLAAPRGAQNLSYLTRKGKGRIHTIAALRTAPQHQPVPPWKNENFMVREEVLPLPAGGRTSDYLRWKKQDLEDSPLDKRSRPPQYERTPPLDDDERFMGLGEVMPGQDLWIFKQGKEYLEDAMERERANAALLTEAHHRTAGVPGTEEQNPHLSLYTTLG